MTKTLTLPDGMDLEEIKAGGIHVVDGVVIPTREGDLSLRRRKGRNVVRLTYPDGLTGEDHHFFTSHVLEHMADPINKPGEYDGQCMFGPFVGDLDDDELTALMSTMAEAPN